jgi:hypothetical protein
LAVAPLAAINGSCLRIGKALPFAPATGSREMSRAGSFGPRRAHQCRYSAPAPQAQNADRRLLPSMRHWCTLPKFCHVEAPATVPSRRGEQPNAGVVQRRMGHGSIS